MRVEAVLFDLDDTLISQSPAIEAGYAAVAERVWGCSSEDRIMSLESAARAFWKARAPHQNYLARVHIGLTDCLHGDLTGDGLEAEALRRFLPELHRQAFEAVLPADSRRCSHELVDLWRETRLNALRDCR